MIFRHLQSKRRAEFQLDRLKRAKKRTTRQEEFLNDLMWIRGQQNPDFKKQKVLILGAGMAGLSCAYELSRLGFQVEVLEAEKKHVGGRVRTHRTKSKQSGEIYAELGAMRIPTFHSLTHQYITDFELKKRPFRMTNGNTYNYVRNHAIKNGDIENDENVVKRLFQLNAEESKMGYFDMWEKAVLDVVEGLSAAQQAELFGDQLRDPRLIELDHKPLAAALIDAKLSKEASDYVMTMIGLETGLPIALTEFLREEKEDLWGHDFEEIVGGTDLMASAFHKALGGKIKQGCAVTRIDRTDAGKPRAIYTDAEGETQQVTGDWMICTIPLGVLNRLDIEGAFSPQKQRAIQGVNYDPSTKVLGRSPYRWWEKDEKIFGGGSSFDNQMGSTWYPSDNWNGKSDSNDGPIDARTSDQESMFLASYTWGQLARRMAVTRGKSDMNDLMRMELSRIHPTLAKNPELFETEIIWPWDQINHQAGAYAFFMPGEQYRFYNVLKEPEGNIFLAGEHVSHSHAWIQGAFESGVETMERIVKTLQQAAS